MEKRRNEIVNLANAQGSFSFSQLKAAFPQVSEMTLRTDLKALDQAKRIIRVHGGAKSIHQIIGTDDLLDRRMQRNMEAKGAIARKALALLRPNITLYIDSGSTTTALARLIPDENCLIFTNGISCAMELSRLTTGRVTMPGGQLNRYSMSVCGIQSILEMSKINVDLMFLGVTCYSSDTGFTCGVEMEAKLKQTVMSRSEQIVVLMDSTKLGKKSTYTICDLSEVDAVISDERLPEDFLSECRKYGVAVY